MRVLVQKYGGSSVADLDRIGRVADRIAATCADGTGVVVVVSAMGNTTDQLLDLARQVSAQPDRRELDMLVSVGERVTMALVAMALRERSVPAISLTGSQSGIITDEAHADARVIAVRPERVRDALAAGQVVIVAGFQGVSRDREVTTLGRGGSDMTAVVLAAALGAEYCELCSDVDGVWSADPHRVPDAVPLSTLGLEAALALARGGARVVYEEAVRYARDNGVQIQASATTGTGRGTRLTVAPSADQGVVAVAGQVLVRAQVEQPSAIQAIVDAGGRIRHQVDDVVWVDPVNAHGGLADIAGLRSLGEVGQVTAIGSGIADDGRTLLQGAAALREAGLRTSDAGASGDACWWRLAPGVLDEGVRVVHDALLTSATPR